MKDNESLINQNDHETDIVAHKLKAIILSWSNLPKEELLGIMEKISIPVIELSRRSEISPEHTLDETPSRIILNGQDFRVTKNPAPNLRMKKLIRDSVKEPAIRGVRNGGMSLDEKVLKRKIKQARLERGCLTFQAVEPVDENGNNNHRRDTIKNRLSKRWETRSLLPIVNNKPNISVFAPENIMLNNLKDIISPDTMCIQISLNEALSLFRETGIFPNIENILDIPKIIGSSVNTSETKSDFLKQLTTAMDNGDKINLILTGLPCMNPNPLNTDHVGKGINIPTFLFLLRLQHFATEMTKVLKTDVSFSIVREIEHLQKLFSLTDDEVAEGKNQILNFVNQTSCDKVKIIEIPVDPSIQIEEGNTNKEQSSEKFVKTFLNSSKPMSQTELSIMISKHLNEKDGVKLLKKNDIDERTVDEALNRWQSIAEMEARMWEKIHQHFDKNLPPIRACEKRIRVTNRNAQGEKFVLKSITDNNSGNPSQPQHCSVGIDDKKQVITNRRVDFLLHPSKWVELQTEIGSFFVSRLLLEN